MEFHWSRRAFPQVLHELGFRTPSSAVWPDDPVLAFQQAGFSVIQQRATFRQTRLVSSKTNAENLVAELVIDEVSYLSVPLMPIFLEVELEARAASSKSISLLTTLLTRRFPSLSEWPCGKLVTGHALKSLWEAGHLGALLDQHHRLKAEAYQQILDVVASYSAIRRGSAARTSDAASHGVKMPRWPRSENAHVGLST